jgi:hypothetical protein
VQRTGFRRAFDHSPTGPLPFRDNVLCASVIGVADRTPLRRDGSMTCCVYYVGAEREMSLDIGRSLEYDVPMAERERFEMSFDPRFRGLLFGLGVTPGTSFVVLTAHDRFLARFGPWRVLTPFDNIREVCVTGPYQWWKAIGPRLSMVDRGLTFGTGTAGGVCVLFNDPVPGASWLPYLKHTGLTVTVEDRDALSMALRTRATA